MHGPLEPLVQDIWTLEDEHFGDFILSNLIARALGATRREYSEWEGKVCANGRYPGIVNPDVNVAVECDIGEPGLAATSEVEVSIPQRTDALIRGLNAVLVHHHAPDDILTAVATQLHDHLDSSIDEGVWLKRSKYALTFPLAKYLGNELPPVPTDGGWKPAGVLHRWFNNRRFFNRQNTHLWYSWLQGKRSTLPASMAIVRKTYDTHLATLTKVDPGCDKTIKSIFSDPTFEAVLKDVKKRMTPIFTRLCEKGEGFVELNPSASACFERTRGSGGQQGFLCEMTGMTDFTNTDLHRMNFFPKVYSRESRGMRTQEVRVYDGESQWNYLIGLSKAFDRTRPIRCTIQAVLEPMKVRVISKGEALPYYQMRPLQRAMHTAMRSMNCFRLIGRPLCPTDLIDCRENVPANWEWFSVDYSAATDGLSWKYSGEIFKYLISDLPSDQKEIAMAVLGPHALHYPCEGRAGVQFKGVMQNGQLMGSVLSFPILCLANLGVYLETTRDLHEGMGWSNRERLSHVLVNGDDMVYAAPLELWSRHIDIGKKVGLEMSVGKAYHHRAYLNVNSTSVHFDMRDSIPMGVMPSGDLFDTPRLDTVTPWQINFLNVGLFFGQHKVQGRSEGDSSSNDLAASHHADVSCVENINSVLGGSLPGRQCDLLRRFLNYNRENVLLQTGRLFNVDGRKSMRSKNLFLPIQAGGCGVIAPLGWRYKISYNDRVVATEKILACSARLSFGRPTPGPELDKLPDSLESRPWKRTCSDVDSESITKIFGAYKCPTGLMHVPVLYWEDVRSLRI